MASRVRVASEAAASASASLPLSLPLPLACVRVLELAGLAPVPFCGMLLSDWGADVVRVRLRPPLTLSLPSPCP